jgi:ankyrin repeat protein
MHLVPVAWDAALTVYEHQAEQVLSAFSAGAPEVIDAVWHSHPRFLDDEVRWLPQPLTREQVASAAFDLDDARLVVARGYGFLDWAALAEHVSEVGAAASDTSRFEAAVQATIDGQVPELERLLDAHPSLVSARSTRRTCHDPSVHAATLLHYLVANGVENVNRRTPPNAVEVARLLLARGADPNADAHMYGGRCTVMSMLVSSAHPAAAGVQVALVDLLVAHGASVDDGGEGAWTSPLRTALVFGYRDVADALVRHGAPVETFDLTSGMGQAAIVERRLAGADAGERHRALAFAAQLGHEKIVEMLLAHGEDPDRFNPDGLHSHATPLHQAALGGHLGVVGCFIRRGARLDIRDTFWDATPLGWAEHGGRDDVAALLRAHGAP